RGRPEKCETNRYGREPNSLARLLENYEYARLVTHFIRHCQPKNLLPVGARRALALGSTLARARHKVPRVFAPHPLLIKQVLQALAVERADAHDDIDRRLRAIAHAHDLKDHRAKAAARSTCDLPPSLNQCCQN